MPDDDAEPGDSPLLRYIADSRAEDNRLAAAQVAADRLEVELSTVADLLREKFPGRGRLLTGAELEAAQAFVASASGSGSAATVSAAFARTWDKVKVNRHPDMEKLTSDLPKNRAAITANQMILVAVLFVAAIYPVLPPEVQRYLATEAGLMSALAAILALLKSDRDKK